MVSDREFTNRSIQLPSSRSKNSGMSGSDGSMPADEVAILRHSFDQSIHERGVHRKLSGKGYLHDSHSAMR